MKCYLFELFSSSLSSSIVEVSNSSNKSLDDWVTFKSLSSSILFLFTFGVNCDDSECFSEIESSASGDDDDDDDELLF